MSFSFEKTPYISLACKLGPVRCENTKAVYWSGWKKNIHGAGGGEASENEINAWSRKMRNEL